MQYNAAIAKFPDFEACAGEDGVLLQVERIKSLIEVEVCMFWGASRLGVDRFTPWIEALGFDVRVQTYGADHYKHGGSKIFAAWDDERHKTKSPFALSALSRLGLLRAQGGVQVVVEFASKSAPAFVVVTFPKGY